MEQELEIEYKNLLTEDEYQTILENEYLKLNQDTDYQKISQTNHYFDTNKADLKKQGAALRIRSHDYCNELTFKVPSHDFLMESNFNLDKNQTEYILNKGSLKLSQLTSQPIKLNLKNIDLNSTFIHFNTFSTLRYEKKDKHNLLVLDQSFFQNKTMDFELEVEGENPEDAKKYFNSILNKYNIPLRPALPKIARAEKNKE